MEREEMAHEEVARGCEEVATAERNTSKNTNFMAVSGAIFMQFTPLPRKSCRRPPPPPPEPDSNNRRLAWPTIPRRRSSGELEVCMSMRKRSIGAVAVRETAPAMHPL